MKVVVFGSGGQLGRELSRARWAAGIEPLLLAEAEADITDARAVAAALGLADVGLAINAAAYTAVDKAETERELAFRVNAEGVRTLAGACVTAKIPLIHVSTDYVFDGTKAGAYEEDDPIRPLGVYGESKAAGEASVRESLREHAIVRTSWLFSAVGQNFVKTILRLATERDELRIVADQFGRPTPAKDLARALVLIAGRLARNEAVAWGTYHFAGAGRASWYDFARQIVELQAQFTGKRPHVAPISSAEYPTPARRPANSELCTDKFERSFGYEPEAWQLGLEDVVKELLGA